MGISSYSGTPASNTSINGINVAEGCPPSGINDAIRQLMADVVTDCANKNVATNYATAQNWAQGANIASATTTDIGAATGNYVSVTGTTTITGFGTIQAGTWRVVKFAGILTLTYNATSLILPGAADITTAAGDTALFVSEGSGNWRCVSYQIAASAPGGLTASSAATLTNKTYDTAGTGNVFKVNGTAISDKLGTGKVILGSTLPVFTVKQQTFTASGTYTPSTGMLYCIAEAVGGGGGGGGNTTSGGGGGGGAGAYAKSTITAATIGVSQTVTIGAAGTAGAAGGGNGGNGGSTSLGALVVCGGGLGGAGVASGGGVGGAGGASSAGDIQSYGAPGNLAISAQNGGASGGSSPFGGGGVGNNGGTGAAGRGYGAGGAGGGGGNFAGGAGSAGVIYITEYCSQ